MGPGLPGFGIASIFYICAAILAPFRQLFLTVRGRADRSRWSTALTQCMIGLGMIGALVSFYIGLDVLIQHGVLPVSRGPEALARIPNWIYATIVLLVVLGSGSIAGAIAAWRSPDDAPDVVAAAHSAGVAEVILDLRATAGAPLDRSPTPPCRPPSPRWGRRPGPKSDLSRAPRWRPLPATTLVQAY